MTDNAAQPERAAPRKANGAEATAPLPQATRDARFAHSAVLDEDDNITARKQVEQELLGSEMRYRRLFESAKDGILILDAETGMIEDVNPFLIQLLGLSRQAFLGKQIWELGFFHDIVANQDGFLELQHQEYIRYEDKPLRTAAGRQVDVEFVSNVYLAGHQKVIQCNIRDITARKRADEALRASEQEFHSLAESLPQIVWVTCADGGNIYFNQQWVDYTGLTLEQSYGHGWNTPFHPDDKQGAWDAWQRATQHHDTYSVECRLRRADGVYRWWLIRGVPQHDANGAILKWFGTCTDIEDIKQAEMEREVLQAQLLQAQKLESIGTLAGGVAHEINNPVMGIMNYAELIVDELGPDSAVTEYATEIGKETQRVATIVKNLLSFARVDKDTYKSPAGLCDIVEETLSLVRAVIRHDQIALEVDVPAELPKILCRSQQIRQVLMNLLTNARDTLNQKYPGHDENKRIIMRGREIVIGEQACVRLTVQDHGSGIPQDVLAHIFDPFFSTKARHKGTGLGLSVSHGIVRDHGGTLSVESEVGQWTRFHMDVPVVADAL